MAQSTNAIQLKSDLKRGVKPKSYKLNIETIDLIAQLSEQTGKPQSVIIAEAVQMLKESLSE